MMEMRVKGPGPLCLLIIIPSELRCIFSVEYMLVKSLIISHSCAWIAEFLKIISRLLAPELGRKYKLKRRNLHFLRRDCAAVNIPRFYYIVIIISI